jgi:hypothetical protein
LQINIIYLLKLWNNFGKFNSLRLSIPNQQQLHSNLCHRMIASSESLRKRALRLETKALSAIGRIPLIEVLVRSSIVAGEDAASDLQRELVRFLVVKAEANDTDATAYSPSELVDKAWHQLMLFPGFYHKLCIDLCGQIIDHNPLGGDEGCEQRQQALKLRYKLCFGRSPPVERAGAAKAPRQKRLRSASEQATNARPAKTPKSSGFNIVVKCITGKDSALEVEPSDSVYTLKEKYQNKEGVPLGQLSVLFNRVRLEDDRTLSDYNIEEGSTLYMVLELRGC